MSEITKRAQQFANYWCTVEPTETENAKDLFSEAVEDELSRGGLSFEDKLEVIKKAIELIEKQEPKTKQERFEDIWKNKNFFTKRGIDVSTGEELPYWDKSRLESYCQDEGISLQDFIDWKIRNNKVD